MKDLTLTIGHNVNGVPTHTFAHVVAFTAAALQIKGLTAWECTGFWEGEVERSTRIEIGALEEDRLEKILTQIPSLAEALKQNAITVQIRDSATAFVEPIRISATA